MISEEAQEQATLYALGLLDAREAAAFERAQEADAELRALVSDLRETVGALAWTADGNPPLALKARVLSRVDQEKRPAPRRTAQDPPERKVTTRFQGGTWLPWALAAALALCCGALALSRERWRQSFTASERRAAALEVTAANSRQVAPTPAAPEPDPWSQVVFCSLEPTAANAARPQVAVLWDASRREGKVRVSKLPPPGAGKDYQLWVVEAGRKEPVSAGVVSVDEGGGAEATFRPVSQGGKEPAAFALSLERAGGSPTNAGPILFLGKL